MDFVCNSFAQTGTLCTRIHTVHEGCKDFIYFLNQTQCTYPLFGFKAKITNLIVERKGVCHIVTLPKLF